MEQNIAFIGSGQMAEAMARGILQSGLSSPERLFCSDVNAERLKLLHQRYGVQTSADNLQVIRQAQLVIYAVKPQVMESVLEETVPTLDTGKVIVTIAAGVPLSAFAPYSQQPLRLIRAMPNLCVAVKAGATALVPGLHARGEDLEAVQAIFNAVGRSIVLPSEALLDAVTGLSGSGPAYLFLVLEALADAGVNMGLTREHSLLLAGQTLLGAAQMQFALNLHPAQLKEMVTSPGGTTIAGLHVLERGGMRGLLMDAVEAACLRAKALGQRDSKRS